MSSPSATHELGNISIRQIDGYASLANFIASDHDRSTLIFKQFDQLSIRNLLYFQSELAELQADQQDLDREDSLVSTSMSQKQCAKNWRELKKKACLEPRDAAEVKRYDLAMKIRETLKAYHEALLLESTLASLSRPSRRTLDAVRHEFFKSKSGQDEGYSVLGGASRHLFDDEHDLIAMRSIPHQDRMTKLVRDQLPLIFKSGPARNGNISISDRRIQKFVAFASTLLAAFLLIGAIVALYVVRSPVVKLVMIGIFTALFAGTVGLLTNAGRGEVFGATAAYAAVLVVFVSGNLGMVDGQPSR